jgi:hypothetical protein
VSDIDPRPILAQFGFADVPLVPVEGGHINRSWKGVPRSPLSELDPAGQSFLLQRINPQVFPDGELVVTNVASVCDHLLAAARRRGIDRPERRVMQLVRDSRGNPGVRAEDGAWWRVLHFIEGTRAYHRVESPDMALEAGRAFGLFQQLLSDYAGSPLAETIPGFHDTRKRLEVLEQAASRDLAGRAGECREELRVVQARAGYANVLPQLMAAGELPTRIVHNDAKIGNVLFDQPDHRALAVIDLDTVMSGTLLSDMGDLIRSMASPTDEDQRELSRIAVSLPVVESVVRGFVEGSGGMLSGSERALLVFSGILLAYEQGIRFLTDHLDGDRYYRIARPGQNLDRARAQFALVAELERSKALLERRVEEIVRACPERSEG